MNNPVILEQQSPVETTILPTPVADLIDYISLVDTYESFEQQRAEEAREVNNALSLALSEFLNVHGQLLSTRTPFGTDKAAEPIDANSPLLRATPEITFVNGGQEMIFRVVSYVGVSSAYRSSERAFALQRKLDEVNYRNVVLAHTTDNRPYALDYEGGLIQGIDGQMYLSAIKAIFAEIKG